MIPAAAVIATALSLAGPAAGPEPSHAAIDADDAAIEASWRLAGYHERAARRERLWRGSLGAGFGVAQAGLGIYGLVDDDFTPVMKRAAVAQVALGTASVGFGIYALARRSANERMLDEPAFVRWRRNPRDRDALERATEVWRGYALRNRRWRRVMGGGYAAGGLVLVGLGTAILVPRDTDFGDTETLWAYMSLATGVSVVLKGATDIAIPSPVERSYRAHAAALDISPDIDDRPGRRRRRRSTEPDRTPTVSVTLGGLAVSGRF